LATWSHGVFKDLCLELAPTASGHEVFVEIVRNYDLISYAYSRLCWA